MNKKSFINKNSRKSVNVIAYEFIKQCIQEVRNEDKKQITDKLTREEGLLARLRRFLFAKPLINYIKILTLVFLLLLIGIFIVKEINNPYLDVVYFFSSLFLYLLMTVFLELVIIPKSEMEYDELWSLTVSKALSKLSNEKNELIEAKHINHLNDIQKLKYLERVIQRSISYYHREGELLGYILKFLGGGVFIGCLPDSKFQKTLLSFPNIIAIWNVNPFGAICLIVILFISPLYFFRYNLPKVWMGHVIAQIKIELQD